MNRTPDNDRPNPISRAFSKFFERGRVGTSTDSAESARSMPGAVQRDAPETQAKNTAASSQRTAARGTTTDTAGASASARSSDGRVQGGTTAASTPSSASATPTATAAPRMYTVVKGDSLSKIAQRVYGRADRWKFIFEANRGTISDPDLIHPGQVLVLPEAPTVH